MCHRQRMYELNSSQRLVWGQLMVSGWVWRYIDFSNKVINKVINKIKNNRENDTFITYSIWSVYSHKKKLYLTTYIFLIAGIEKHHSFTAEDGNKSIVSRFSAWCRNGQYDTECLNYFYIKIPLIYPLIMMPLR